MSCHPYNTGPESGSSLLTAPKNDISSLVGWMCMCNYNTFSAKNAIDDNRQRTKKYHVLFVLPGCSSSYTEEPDSLSFNPSSYLKVLPAHSAVFSDNQPLPRLCNELCQSPVTIATFRK